MPKIEKDLLKVKGSDGQWHYVPAVGGSVDTAPTWDEVQNKPFSTLGSGLEVDENGVLSAEGGGSDNAVQYVAQELTDEQKTQARENIGAGTSSFSGSYNDLTSKPTIPTQVTIDSTLKQSGQAADAKAVGDALATKLDKNQGARNAGKILGIGEDGIVVPQDKPTYTLTDADKTAVADAVVADGIAATLVDLPSGGGEKEWTKILEVEVTEATASFEVSDLDNYTEFLVINSGLQNATSMDSAQELYINNTKVFANFVDVPKSGGLAYNYAIAKYNGMVWECHKAGKAISATNLAPSTAYIPYNVVLGVGKATSMKTATANTTYAPVSGKITIYGR